MTDRDARFMRVLSRFGVRPEHWREAMERAKRHAFIDDLKSQGFRFTLETPVLTIDTATPGSIGAADEQFLKSLVE